MEKKVETIVMGYIGFGFRVWGLDLGGLGVSKVYDSDRGLGLRVWVLSVLEFFP